MLDCWFVMMIVAVSSKIIWALRVLMSGKQIHFGSSLSSSNLGNFWRITSQILTDFYPEAF